ncbi:MAG: competence/damage-inducible protein A [Rickettsiales bacterium]
MTQPVTAAMMIIGNEILSGRTQDTNLAYLAKRLNAVGVQVREARVVPDVEATIVKTVNELREKYDYVFTSGGIGPTHDDITSASIAAAFGVPLVRDAEAVRRLEEAYRGTDKLNEARLKMADVPQGAALIDNEVTAAPGFRMENVYVMAGIPKICQAMIEGILPQLRSGVTILSTSISTNLAEGNIAAGLTDLQSRYLDVEIGSYPHFVDGGYRTTLVFRSPDAARNDAAAAELSTIVESLGGELIDTPTA